VKQRCQFKHAISAVVVGLMLGASTALAQTWPKFLRDADPSVTIVTPKYRMRIFTGGFDLPHPKIVEKKLPKLLRKNGINENMVRTTLGYARQLTGALEPSTMPTLIDGAVDWVVGEWNGCGGKYSTFIRSFDWSRVTITVRDTIFPNPDTGVMSAGVAMSKTSAHIVNLSFQRWFSDPANAAIIDISGGARWELNNIAMWNYSGRSRDIGTGRPCQ